MVAQVVCEDTLDRNYKSHPKVLDMQKTTHLLAGSLYSFSYTLLEFTDDGSVCTTTWCKKKHNNHNRRLTQRADLTSTLFSWKTKKDGRHSVAIYGFVETLTEEVAGLPWPVIKLVFILQEVRRVEGREALYLANSSWSHPPTEAVKHTSFWITVCLSSCTWPKGLHVLYTEEAEPS